MAKNCIQTISHTLPYEAPFDWGSLLSFFRSHQIVGIEEISDTAYERLFRLHGHMGHLRVTRDAVTPRLRLDISTADAKALPIIAQKIEQMFDLDADLAALQTAFGAHKFWGKIWAAQPGLRLARGWDPYETAIQTILGQLVSVSRARGLMQQLIGLYGESVTHPLNRGKAWLFPTPQALAEASLEGLGTTRNRKKTIRDFSRLVAAKKIDFSVFNIDEMKRQLLDVPGLGPWSVEYIALRALGDRDSFPGTDLILKRVAEKYPKMDLDKVRPWRSYAAIHLWKHYLSLPLEIRTPKPKMRT